MKSTESPLVSVITPLYNAAHTLPYAITSLLMQSYPNWECVLVDDGSEDDSSEVIKSINDPRIRYFRLETNQGRGVARKVALENTKGDYLCFVDADDWIYPDKLSHQISYMDQNPQMAFLSSGLILVDQHDQLIGVQAWNPEEDKLIRHRKYSKPMPHKMPFASSMIRMEVAKEAGFDQNLTRSEDADFLLKIFLKYPSYLLNEVLYVYRLSTNITKKDFASGYKSRMQVFMKYLQTFPWASRKVILVSWLKKQLFGLAFDLGLSEMVIKGRTRIPRAEQEAAYLDHLMKLKSSISNRDLS